MRHTKVVCTERVSWSQSNARWVYKSEKTFRNEDWAWPNGGFVNVSQAMGMEGFEDLLRKSPHILSMAKLYTTRSLFCYVLLLITSSDMQHAHAQDHALFGVWLRMITVDLQKESRLIFDQNMTRSAVPLAPYFEPSRYLGSCWIVGKKRSFSYVCCVTVCVHVKKQKDAGQVSRSDNATTHIILLTWISMTNIHQTWQKFALCSYLLEICRKVASFGFVALDLSTWKMKDAVKVNAIRTKHSRVQTGSWHWFLQFERLLSGQLWSRIHKMILEREGERVSSDSYLKEHFHVHKPTVIYLCIFTCHLDPFRHIIDATRYVLLYVHVYFICSQLKYIYIYDHFLLFAHVHSWISIGSNPL